MVHPYLRRRAGLEDWAFPSPTPPHPANELHDLLGETYGVPLFQEQAMKLAIVAAISRPVRPMACDGPWPPSATRHHP